jgi:hypothetical protein
MLKYIADLMEKLTAGALVVGLFEGKGVALFLGFLFLASWFKMRRIEALHKKEERP